MSSQNPPPSDEGFVSPEAEPELVAHRTTFSQVLTAATPVVWVTPLIVVINVVVFVAMVAMGVSPMSPTTADLFKWGADFGPATVLEGQWWRLLSCAFIHVGVLHIALNMYVFWGAGALAERLYGNVAYLVLYLIAALGGSLVSTLFAPLAVSAGASGAIFGVYGAILAFVRSGEGQLPPTVVAGLQKGVIGFIGYNLVFGLTVPNISNSAHLGGLATGFVAGWLLARDLLAPGRAEAVRYLRLAGLVPVLAALAWGAHHRISSLPTVRSGRLAEDAAAAIGAKDWARARKLLDEAIAIDPGNEHHYLSRGYTRQMDDDRDGAISDYGEAIARNPKSPRALTMRCQALFGAHQYERAVKDCDAALALDKSDAAAWHVRTAVLRWKGRDDEATRAAARLTELDPKSAYPHLLLAGLLIDKGDLTAADREIRKASDLEPQQPFLASTRVHLFLRRGDHVAALREADRAVAVAPKNPTAYSQRATVFRAQRDLTRALADEDRAIELDPSDGGWYNGRAWTLLALDRLPEALAASERSLALEPDSAAALGTRCWVHVSLGDLSAGKADCERAVKLWPGTEIDRGMLDFLDGGYAAAAAAWRRGREKNPADAAFLDAWITKAEAGQRRAAQAR